MGMENRGIKNTMKPCGLSSRNSLLISRTPWNTL